jgi:hypothetical protein
LQFLGSGIIAHLTSGCGGNAHDRHVVEVSLGSFEKEPYGANPPLAAFGNNPDCAAKNAAGFETDSQFYSAYRSNSENL